MGETGQKPRFRFWGGSGESLEVALRQSGASYTFRRAAARLGRKITVVRCQSATGRTLGFSAYGSMRRGDKIIGVHQMTVPDFGEASSATPQFIVNWTTYRPSGAACGLQHSPRSSIPATDGPRPRLQFEGPPSPRWR